MIHAFPFIFCLVYIRPRGELCDKGKKIILIFLLKRILISHKRKDVRKDMQIVLIVAVKHEILLSYEHVSLYQKLDQTWSSWFSFSNQSFLKTRPSHPPPHPLIPMHLGGPQAKDMNSTWSTGKKQYIFFPTSLSYVPPRPKGTNAEDSPHF